MGTKQQIYSCCRDAVGGLLSAMDAQDLRGIEDELSRLRAFLSTRDAADQLCEAGRRQRLDRLFEERLDALEGVVDAIQCSVRGLRQSTGHEMSRLRETAPLLRHLTTA